MRFASPDAPKRPDYIDVAEGISVQFSIDMQPTINWNHIDGPVLWTRDCQMHWITLWERFQCWIGRADAFTLERKYSPEFVHRWNERAMTAPMPAHSQVSR